MVWKFIKNIAADGADFVADSAKNQMHKRRVRKSFELYFKSSPDNLDPFLFAKAITEEDFLLRDYSEFTGVALIYQISGAFNRLHHLFVVDRNEDSIASDFELLERKNDQIILETLKDKCVGLFRDLERFDPSEITKLENVCENYNTWMNEMKDAFFGQIDQMLDRIKLMEIGKFELSDHLEAFTERLHEAKTEDLIQENQSKLVDLYKSLSDAFGRNKLVAIRKLATVPEDVNRINQIETIIDLYTLKMRRVTDDKGISEDEREMKMASWQSLMESDIQALGGAS